MSKYNDRARDILMAERMASVEQAFDAFLYKRCNLKISMSEATFQVLEIGTPAPNNILFTSFGYADCVLFCLNRMAARIAELEKQISDAQGEL